MLTHRLSWTRSIRRWQLLCACRHLWPCPVWRRAEEARLAFERRLRGQS